MDSFSIGNANTMRALHDVLGELWLAQAVSAARISAAAFNKMSLHANLSTSPPSTAQNCQIFLVHGCHLLKSLSAPDADDQVTFPAWSALSQPIWSLPSHPRFVS